MHTATDRNGVPRQKINPRFANIFVRDANKTIKSLNEIMAKDGEMNEADLRSYIINVHGMKSALAGVGNIELSEKALELEIAGRESDTKLICEKTQIFINELQAYADENTAAEAESSGIAEDTAFLNEMLAAIKISCGEYDELDIEERLAELNKKNWLNPTKNLLNTISNQLLVSGFDEIAEAVDDYFKST